MKSTVHLETLSGEASCFIIIIIYCNWVFTRWQ